MKGELERFILRANARKMFRDALRMVRKLAPDHARTDLRKEIRGRFEANASTQDPKLIRRLLAEGKQELELLEQMLKSGTGG
mmetsp:Transcript_13461/g.39717  ORF Transcript_13461/g.39717 Transcript_13461/m.39717 type:complete len:82 (-) Transcript_13461:386-631(-)